MHKTTQELQSEIEVLENGMAQPSATPDRIRRMHNQNPQANRQM
jgi:hypothetical protein